MSISDLKVVGLNITEDFYEYKGYFQLLTGEKYMDIDIGEIDDNKLTEIKDLFQLNETSGEIKSAIMEKLLEASQVESRNVEGKTWNR